jgi:hypothetical protein
MPQSDFDAGREQKSLRLRIRLMTYSKLDLVEITLIYYYINSMYRFLEILLMHALPLCKPKLFVFFHQGISL